MRPGPTTLRDLAAAAGSVMEWLPENQVLPPCPSRPVPETDPPAGFSTGRRSNG